MSTTDRIKFGHRKKENEEWRLEEMVDGVVNLIIITPIKLLLLLLLTLSPSSLNDIRYKYKLMVAIV